MHFFVEEREGGQKAYESILIKDRRILRSLSNELALKIVKILAEEPSCAMDIARRLKEHEQKIYYHLRNLEKFGIIEVLRTEERVGALAKIYRVKCPFISFKLFEGGKILDKKVRIKEIKFLEPFVKDGKFNARIIVGSPDPHGKYGAQASDSCCAIDLALFLGTFVKNAEIPNYKLDTEVKENDLKENLILVGGPKANVIVERINKDLPLFFEFKKEWSVFSTISKSLYLQDEVGVIERIKNPFSKKSEILILAGKRFKGTRAAVLAFVKKLKEIEKGNKFDSSKIAKVVLGIDRDCDGIVDDAEFLE